MQRRADSACAETLVLGNAMARARAAEHSSSALPSRAASAVAASMFEHPSAAAAQQPAPRPPTRARSSSALPAAPLPGCDLAASQLLLPKAVFGPAADEMLLRYVDTRRASMFSSLFLFPIHALARRPAPLPPPTQPCRPSVAPPDSRVWACRYARIMHDSRPLRVC